MLLLFILVLLLSNSLSFKQDISIYYARVGFITLIYSIYICYNNLFITYLNQGIGLYGGLFNISSLIFLLYILILILNILILNLTGFYSKKILKDEKSNIYILLPNKIKKYIYVLIHENGEQFSILEYTIILFFVITGSLLLISSSDLVSVYLTLELQSYGLYLLCTIYRNSEISISSGLTYFLLGGLSSCFILLGIGLIYANVGTTYLDGFYIITNLSNIINEEQNKLIY
jgi:NADH-ubiquinone oxidoreductase chain 2